MKTESRSENVNERRLEAAANDVIVWLKGAGWDARGVSIRFSEAGCFVGDAAEEAEEINNETAINYPFGDEDDNCCYHQMKTEHKLTNDNEAAAYGVGRWWEDEVGDERKKEIKNENRTRK